MRTKIFPTLILVLSLGASIVYAIEPGEWRKAAYWGATVVIAYVLTF